MRVSVLTRSHARMQPCMLSCMRERTTCTPQHAHVQVLRDVEDNFMPWLQEQAVHHLSQGVLARQVGAFSGVQKPAVRRSLADSNCTNGCRPTAAKLLSRRYLPPDRCACKRGHQHGVGVLGRTGRTLCVADTHVCVHTHTHTHARTHAPGPPHSAFAGLCAVRMRSGTTSHSRA